MNLMDSREFLLLGQKIDVDVWWHGGNAGGGGGGHQNINGRDVDLWSYGNIWSHNVIQYPMVLGESPFNLWKWFNDNVSTIEEWDWTCPIDDLYKVTWAFMADGTFETNAPGGSGFSHGATFFITLIKYPGSRGYYLIAYAPSSEIALQDFDTVVGNSVTKYVKCQNEFLHYYGFDPLQGFTDNDLYAGSCHLAVPQHKFIPDFAGGNPQDQLDDTYFCLIQNGTIFQQCLRDGDNTLYNDMTGRMTTQGVGNMRTNMPAGLLLSVSSVKQDGTTPVQGYYPNLGVHEIGTIGEDFYCTIYEMCVYLVNGQIGAKEPIPWTNFNGIPMEAYTIENTQDDVEPVDEEGGEGEYIQDDDEQNHNPLPNVDGEEPSGDYGSDGGASSTGMVHLYSPSDVQMRAFSAAVLWNDDFLVAMEKLFTTDPIEAIISLGYLPINLNSWKGADTDIVIGTWSTNALQMPLLKKDYILLDAGKITVKEKWGAAIDYDPYSSCELYLPFIGYVIVSMSDILHPNSQNRGGGTGELVSGEISLIYKVNLFTGDCVAQVFGLGVPQPNGQVNKHLIGQYCGNCMEYIPFTGTNYSNFYKNQVSSVALGIGGIAGSLVSGNPLIGAGAIASSAMNAINQPPQIQRSGGASGGASRLQYLRPFIRLTRPAQSLALSLPDASLNQKGYKNLEGVACNFYVDRLNDCVGYTQVDVIELKGFNATDAELNEVEALLKNGVFIGTGH